MDPWSEYSQYDGCNNFVAYVCRNALKLQLLTNPTNRKSLPKKHDYKQSIQIWNWKSHPKSLSERNRKTKHFLFFLRGSFLIRVSVCVCVEFPSTWDHHERINRYTQMIRYKSYIEIYPPLGVSPYINSLLTIMNLRVPQFMETPIRTHNSMGIPGS